MKNWKMLSSACLLCMLMAAACKPDAVAPINDDGSAPGPVKNVQVQNISGGAQLSFSLPDAANLLYVKAVYDIKGGKMEARSSFYKNNLTVEGYGDTKEHEVLVYAVSRSEKVSAPVKVTIKPLTPAVINIRNSLTVAETFGGIFVGFKNPDKANVVVKVMIEDSAKNWVTINNFYTSLDSGKFSTRGLLPVQRKFGIFVKDRWENVSDTLVVLKTPVYEEELDKTKWADMRKKNYPIPQIGDLPNSGLPIVEPVDYSSSYPAKNLWDNNTGSMFHTKEKYDLPFWFPIDLGVKAVLSRYKIWQRTGTFTFNHGNPHKWEIWGTNDLTKANSWVKLTTQIMEKPSGSPVGTNTNDDTDAATNGQEFDFPVGIPAVRYIAWKHIDSWGSIDGYTGHLHLMELSIWGQKQ